MRKTKAPKAKILTSAIPKARIILLSPNRGNTRLLGIRLSIGIILSFRWLGSRRRACLRNVSIAGLEILTVFARFVRSAIRKGLIARVRQYRIVKRYNSLGNFKWNSGSIVLIHPRGKKSLQIQQFNIKNLSTPTSKTSISIINSAPTFPKALKPPNASISN